MTASYVVVGAKPWNRRAFEEKKSHLPGKWHFLASREELTVERLEPIDPQYVFFLHWSWKVPPSILDRFECVCFHMTDVPYGRGGSPLQNLIARGHRSTKLTALRMVKNFDAGPVYMKEDLCLEGGAEEIYIRATRLSMDMIARIVDERPEPIPQQGTTVIFRRRKPAQSRIGETDTLRELHDFIRMLDADGYPAAFLEYGGFRFEFTRSTLYNGRIQADVRITRIDEDAQ